MTCFEAEEQLLESMDDALPDDARRAVDAHLAACARCTAFAASLRVVDLQLAVGLRPAPPPASIAMNVRTRIRRERRAARIESLPDFIHLAGCTIATVLSAALLPVDAAVSMAAGVGFTCVSYVFMAVVRWSLEAAGQPDW